MIAHPKGGYPMYPPHATDASPPRPAMLPCGGPPPKSRYYWQAVIANLWKDRKSWCHMDRILGQEGAYTWTSGRFYVMFIQAIILFWVRDVNGDPLH